MKDHRFWELQLVVLWFSHVSIDFHPKKVIEFTTTAAVFKWELVQHITEQKLANYFEDVDFLHWRPYV